MSQGKLHEDFTGYMYRIWTYFFCLASSQDEAISVTDKDEVFVAKIQEALVYCLAILRIRGCRLLCFTIQIFEQITLDFDALNDSFNN